MKADPVRILLWSISKLSDVTVQFITQVPDECYRIQTLKFMYVTPDIVFITKVGRT